MSASLFRKFTSPSGSAASSPARCSSPSSPTRTSRLQEKEELIGLNNRLAVYIEKVRSLEQENSKLTTQIKSSQEVVTKEVTNIKTLYENELATARGIMDETAKERAKLQIDLGSAISDKEELTFKLRQKENELKNSETTVEMQDTEISNLKQRLNKLNNDKKKDDNELKDLRSSVAKLRQQLDETRAQLESESLGRVDLMNRLQSQREDFDFKMNVYEEQLKESHSRTSFEISQVDGSLRSDYEDRLSTALHDLRAQYEQQMKANREEVEQLYELKLSELRGSHTRSQQSTSTTLKELRDTRARIESLNDRVNQLEATNASLLVRVRELETQLDGERAAGAVKDEHLSALEQRMQDQLQEYQDLMDTKLALDIEIAAYRKLLEAEEARLNISPLGKFGGGRSAAAAAAAAAESPSLNRAGKRKRTLMEASASCSSSTTSCYQLEGASTCHGALEIVEECADGKFVRVRNNSDKEESLGGGQLVRSCVASSEQGDSRPDVEYKFPRTIRLGAGELCTVWSADAGVPHEPPHALVMRGQHWPMAEHFSTSLLDKNGEELAKRVTKRVSVVVGDMGENGQDHSENGSHSSDWKLLNIFGSKRATPRR